MSRHRRIFALAQAAGLLFAVAADAQPSEVEALHQRGQAEFAAGHLEAALEIFNRLYAHTREPRALARLATVEAAMSRWENAWNHLALALAAANNHWVRENRSTLLRNRARIEPHLAALEVRANVTGAELLVNGQRVATLPLREPLRLAPGRARVEVRLAEFMPFTCEVELLRGAVARVEATLTPVDHERPTPVAEVAPAPPSPAPDVPAPTRPPRLVFDVGAGVGLAFISGQMPYAEQFLNATTRTPECGMHTCYRNIDPGFAPTFWLNANVRFNFNRRVGLGAGIRFQFDTADWAVQPPNGGGPTKSNDFANLLIMLRAYVATNRHGFPSAGPGTSLFAGFGVGQIEPKPGLPPSARYPSAHVVSGFGNFHVGVRQEYSFRSGFHLAGEFTLQFMFPTFLFNADLAFLVGAHF